MRRTTSWPNRIDKLKDSQILPGQEGKMGKRYRDKAQCAARATVIDALSGVCTPAATSVLAFVR